MVYISGSSMKPSKELFFDEFGNERIREPIWKRIGTLNRFCRTITKRFGLVKLI